MNILLRRLLSNLKKRATVVLVGLTTLALVITNLDSLATVWTKHFGPSSEIVALQDAINQPLAPHGPSVVQLELVQTPREQNDEQMFDVYLKNNSSEDVLLTNLTYGDGYMYASAGITGSETFRPDSSYTIPVKRGLRHSAALSPPYLLKGRSRGAIRFRFAPEQKASTTLAFELYDSAGSKVAAVNAFRGK